MSTTEPGTLVVVEEENYDVVTQRLGYLMILSTLKTEVFAGHHFVHKYALGRRCSGLEELENISSEITAENESSETMSSLVEYPEINK